MLGFAASTQPTEGDRTGLRQNIIKLEQTHFFETRDAEGNQITVPSQLNIWIGTQKIEFGGGRLTNPELDWLAQELRNWLDIPVTKLNAVESAKKKS